MNNGGLDVNPTDVRLHRAAMPITWSLATLGGIVGFLVLGLVGAVVGAAAVGLAARFLPSLLGAGSSTPETTACSSCGDATLAESGVCPDCA